MTTLKPWATESNKEIVLETLKKRLSEEEYAKLDKNSLVDITDKIGREFLRYIEEKDLYYDRFYRLHKDIKRYHAPIDEWQINDEDEDEEEEDENEEEEDENEEPFKLNLFEWCGETIEECYTDTDSGRLVDYAEDFYRVNSRTKLKNKIGHGGTNKDIAYVGKKAVYAYFAELFKFDGDDNRRYKQEQKEKELESGERLY